MKTLIFTTALVMSAGMAHAQFLLNSEDGPPAQPGDYEVTQAPAFRAPNLVAFYPADLTPFPTDDTLPLVLWANGGCAKDSAPYYGFMTTLASEFAVTRQNRDWQDRSDGFVVRGQIAIALGADPRVSTIGVFNGGARPARADGIASPLPSLDSLVIRRSAPGAPHTHGDMEEYATVPRG